MQPKAVEPQAQSETTRERDYSSRLSGAISGSIVSIGDVFKDYRDGTKAVRFPRDLLKVLEQKLQDIAMGKDPAYVPRSRRARLRLFIAEYTDTRTNSSGVRWPSSTVKSRTRISENR